MNICSEGETIHILVSSSQPYSKTYTFLAIKVISTQALVRSINSNLLKVSSTDSKNFSGDCVNAYSKVYMSYSKILKLYSKIYCDLK